MDAGNDKDGALGVELYDAEFGEDDGLGGNFSNNYTVDKLLEMYLGPKQVPQFVLAPMTAIYVTLFITGVVGNVAVCVVIIRNRSMHTATNYYLFSLAVSDLVILLLGLPTELIQFWHQYPYLQGEIFCKMRSYVSELASYSSVLTIVSFSFERYLAICHPLYVFGMADFQRVLRVLCVSWILAGLAAIPYLLFTTITLMVDDPPGSENFIQESAICVLLPTNITPQGYPIYQLSAFIFFVIPVVILLFLYISMAITLRGSIRKHSETTTKHSTAAANCTVTSSRRQIIRMLAVVVIAFFLCWAPFHAQRLGYVYFWDYDIFRTINEYLMYVSGILYYVSSTINPILYNLMSLKYRQAFRKTLCGIENYAAGMGGTTNNVRRWDSAAELNKAPHQGVRRMSAATTTGVGITPTNLLVGRRRSSTVSCDSAAYLPQHLAVREWQRKERDRQEAAKRQRMERRANLQLKQNGHVAKSSVSEPLVEVTEEAISSAASTSVKETSFVFSFKRKSTRSSSSNSSSKKTKQGSVNMISVQDATPHHSEETTAASDVLALKQSKELCSASVPLDFPEPLKCNNDVVHIREELSCQV